MADDPPVITLRKSTVVRVGIALAVLAALGAGIAIGLVVAGGSSPTPSTSATNAGSTASASKSLVRFYIPSGAMEPTLQIGDNVIVNKLAYQHQSVRAGDIVVFLRPADEDCGGSPVADLIKRIIGLPGQTISLRGGDVYVDGRRLDETWLPTSVQGTTFPGPSGPAYSLDSPYKIPAGRYFVMGDNRADSCDSRYWGPITKSLIVGKVTSVER